MLLYKNFSAFVVDPIEIDDIEITDGTPEKVTSENWAIEHKKAIFRDESSPYYANDKDLQDDLFEASLITRVGKLLIVVDENGYFFGKINFIKHDGDYRFMYLYAAGDRRDDFYRRGIKNYERSCFIIWKFASMISKQFIITYPRESVIKYLRQIGAKFLKAETDGEFMLCKIDKDSHCNFGEGNVAVLDI